MKSIDVFKVTLLFYMLVVSWMNPRYLYLLTNFPMKIAWICAIMYIFLKVDIVLGVVLCIAFIITLVKASGRPNSIFMPLKIENHDEQVVKHPAKHLLENPDINKKIIDASSPVNDIGRLGILTKNDRGELEANYALEKYVVNDYLEKASSDNVIAENTDVYPKVLGKQYNIQGIEKDMVTGYDPRLNILVK